MKKQIKFHRIPIYDVRLWVGVADTTEELHKAMEWAFGPNSGGQCGCCCYHHSKFAVLFEKGYLSHELIAHEVFHCTHRIMDFASARFEAYNQEPFAYLNGYLTQLVYKDIDAMGVKIALEMPPVAQRFVLPA